mmetsp:Transcript_15728/g.54813  ORF Transcript_15728/g.54813 Transcript_15728/m.54813 type:complete len:226 (+) Transcript_15728:744-1421(+)
MVRRVLGPKLCQTGPSVWRNSTSNVSKSEAFTLRGPKLTFGSFCNSSSVPSMMLSNLRCTSCWVWRPVFLQGLLFGMPCPTPCARLVLRCGQTSGCEGPCKHTLTSSRILGHTSKCCTKQRCMILSTFPSPPVKASGLSLTARTAQRRGRAAPGEDGGEEEAAAATPGAGDEERRRRRTKASAESSPIECAWFTSTPSTASATSLPANKSGTNTRALTAKMPPRV